MKKALTVFAALILFVTIAACNKGSSFVGTYAFDTEKFMTSLKAATGGQDMPKEVVDNAVKVFETYKITVAENEATITFGDMSVKGTLKLLEKKEAETKFLMTPVDEDKKNEPVTFLFSKDGALTVDMAEATGDPSSQMYFKKQS